MKLRSVFVVAVASLVWSAACGAARPAGRVDRGPVLIASTRLASDVAVVERVTSQPALSIGRIPEWYRQEPLRMALARQRVERQILSRTGQIPPARYQRVLRPLLARALRTAGFSPPDVDSVLRNVDDQRRREGR